MKISIVWTQRFKRIHNGSLTAMVKCAACVSFIRVIYKRLA